MIRVAKFGDIPRMAEIISIVHAASRYADVCDYDEKSSKALLMNAIQRHGGQHEGSTFVAVSENDGKVEGYIIGVLQRFYLVFDALEATDMHWISTRDVNPRDMIKLAGAMHKWAEKSPKVIEIIQANTDAMNNPEAVSRLLEMKLGMVKSGHVLRKEVNYERCS